MTPPALHLQINWSNDGMNVFVPATCELSGDRTFYDDDGFTNDLALSMTLFGEQTSLALQGQHRMITERGGLRRSDELRIGATVQRILRRGARGDLTGIFGLGLVATGPLGGAALQDKFHRLIHWGRTLNGEIKGQLQNQYEGGIRVAPQLTIGMENSQRLSPVLKLYAGGAMRLSEGVGASSVQFSIRVERARKLGKGRLVFWGGGSLRHLRSEEARLSFNGGYPEAKSFAEPFGGLGYVGKRMTAGFGLTLNVEGSGAHQGVLSLGIFLGD